MLRLMYCSEHHVSLGGFFLQRGGFSSGAETVLAWCRWVGKKKTKEGEGMIILYHSYQHKQYYE